MSDAHDEQPSLKVYTEDEIDMLLDGDRRQVDRLIINGINTICRVLTNHVADEAPVLGALGTEKQIRVRNAWVDAEIAKSNAKAAAMRRVAESTVSWALIAFLGFLAVSIASNVVDYIKERIEIKASKQHKERSDM